MTWATVDDMEARFNRADNPELTQLTDPIGGASDPDAVQSALDEAAAIIGGYLGGRELSASDNANLRRVQMNLARWSLYRDAVPDRVQQIYQADIEMLRAIAKREQTIGPTAGGSAATVAVESISGLLPSRGF